MNTEGTQQEIEMLTRALDGFGRYVGEIKDTQWDAPTPNDSWTVRELVHHVFGEVSWEADILAGKTIDQVGDKYAGDILGEHPYAAWKVIAEKALSAAHALPNLEGEVHLSYGDVQARTYLQSQLIELTIHAWDLARAIKAPEKLDPELVHAVYEWFEPQATDYRQTGLMAAPVRLPDAAPKQDQLIALTGRNPQPPASEGNEA